MGISRCKLSIVSLFLMAIFFWYPPLSLHAARGISIIGNLSHKSGKLGAYRALIIGINDYQDPKIPDLKTPVNDAKAMGKLLHDRYGFKVDLLLNRKATRESIFRALRRLASSAKPDDSILIYFAGHGDLDRLTNDGWWIPADAKAGDPITYLDNFLVQTYIRSMQALHVLLISDSCYSGTLFGQARAMPPVIDAKYYLNLYNEKSRWGMTSGNKTPVSDLGSEGHSIFAYQLLKELRRNKKPYISTQEIYTRIAPIISNNSEQTPLCRPIRNTGDQGGEFVFVASSGAEVEKPSRQTSRSYLSVESNVSGANVMVDGQYVGSTSLSNVEVHLGSHRIQVEKDGYEPYTKRIRFEAGRSRDLYVILNPKAPLKSRLYVDTQPEDAKIRILNISSAFYQGIELDAGQYNVEVSANGYETKKMWVPLAAGRDKTLNIRLKLRAFSVLFHDDFKDNRHGWPIYYNGTCLTRIKNGNFIIDARNKKDNGDEIILNRQFDFNGLNNFSLEARIKRKGGAEYKGSGIIWGSRGVGDSYRFEVDAKNRKFVYGLMKNNKWNAIQNWKYSPYIITGNAENTLTVRKKSGSIIELLVNNHVVYSGKFPRNLGGKIGFSTNYDVKIDVEEITFGTY